jgi:hypothetical protein
MHDHNGCCTTATALLVVGHTPLMLQPAVTDSPGAATAQQGWQLCLIPAVLATCACVTHVEQQVHCRTRPWLLLASWCICHGSHSTNARQHKACRGLGAGCQYGCHGEHTTALVAKPPAVGRATLPVDCTHGYDSGQLTVCWGGACHSPQTAAPASAVWHTLLPPC